MTGRTRIPNAGTAPHVAGPGTPPPDQIVVRVDSVIADLVPAYLASRRGELVQLREWIVQADFEQLELLGHRLKGSGAGYGFAEITRLGGALEEAAAANDLPRIQALAEEMAMYLQAVRIELP